jgi:hypothetical protein
MARVGDNNHKMRSLRHKLAVHVVVWPGEDEGTDWKCHEG